MTSSSTTEATTTNAESLKEQGNTATRKGEYALAMMHYTHAIKLDPQNAVLYSNRSFAFLKMSQYSLAMDDAMETIRLRPEWAKGYFRKGEIEFATNHFARAQESYEIAMQCQPIDPTLMTYIKKAELFLVQEMKRDEQIPWLGSGIGIVIGVALLIADYCFTDNPTHPLIMAFVTVGISLIGYVVAKIIRNTMKNQQKSLLNAGREEKDSFEEEIQEELKEKRSTPKYSKSQARQRYRKGKM